LALWGRSEAGRRIAEPCRRGGRGSGRKSSSTGSWTESLKKGETRDGDRHRRATDKRQVGRKKKRGSDYRKEKTNSAWAPDEFGSARSCKKKNLQKKNPRGQKGYIRLRVSGDKGTGSGAVGKGQEGKDRPRRLFRGGDSWNVGAEKSYGEGVSERKKCHWGETRRQPRGQGLRGANFIDMGGSPSVPKKKVRAKRGGHLGGGGF